MLGVDLRKPESRRGLLVGAGAALVVVAASRLFDRLRDFRVAPLIPGPRGSTLPADQEKPRPPLIARILSLPAHVFRAYGSWLSEILAGKR